MNSVIEAQQEFTNCFGELCLNDLVKPNLVLPHFTNEFIEMEQFIEEHEKPAPVVIEITKNKFLDATIYNYEVDKQSILKLKEILK